MPVARRDFLRALGATAAAGCRPGDDTDGAPIAGSIETVVLVMMENRSYDHVLGSRSLVEGLEVDGLRADMTNLTADGTPIAPWLSDRGCHEPDPPHSWDASHLAFADGTNGGFVAAMARSKGTAAQDLVMTYLDRAQQPITYALADAYTSCSRWFSSVMGPTWPNRLFFHGAQSQGMKVNELPDGQFYSMATIWDQLDEAGIPWSYYYTDLPALALFGRFMTRLKTIDQFYADAAAGTLAPVVMVEPGAAFNDDHPPHHTMLGQIFIGSIHNALAASPQWNKCLGIVTYDEAGGFFDHVPPGKTTDERADEGFDQLGFRVPAIVFGPYVKAGYDSKVAYDHPSALSEVQRLFGLAPLNARNEAAADLSDAIDFARLAANDPATPALLPVIELTEEEIAAECSDRRRRRTGFPEIAEMLVDKGLTRYDRTDLAPALAAEFLAQAEALGVCAIRRPR